MKLSEKRTSTQLGLGKVSGEPRHTTKRERVEPGASGSAPPISAPPPSGGPMATGQHPRHTRSLESAPPSERGEPTPSPASVSPLSPLSPLSAPVSVVRTETRPPIDGRVERIDIEDSPISVRGPSWSRTPIDVTHVDTNRLPRDGARAPSKSSDSREGRFAAEEKPTGRRLISTDARLAREDDRADPETNPTPPGSRTVDGRPIGGNRADSARPEGGRPSPDSARSESGRPGSARPGSARPGSARPGSARPNSARPSAGSARPSPGSARPAGRASGIPASIRPPRSSGGPAPSPAPSPATSPIFTKSLRPSIREDNVGAAVKAEAVRGSGQTIPRLLMSKAEIAAAPIDHRAGFLLAHIDGVTSVAALVDICGMPEDELNEILDRLRRLGIVAVR
jgi:hypothetical protein